MHGRTGSRWLTLATLAVLAACAGEPEVGEAEAEAPSGNDQGSSAVTLACSPMTGQMELEGRLSPYDSTRIQVGNNEAVLCYGRPSARGRTMIGGENVPYGQLWRTGANEPTILHLPFAASVAGIDVDPGTYSLYTIPGESQWTIIVNRATEQWGHESTYTPEVESQEVGRGTVPVRKSATYQETFTITSVPAGDVTNLVMEWENTRVEIPIRGRG